MKRWILPIALLGVVLAIYRARNSEEGTPEAPPSSLSRVPRFSTATVADVRVPALPEAAASPSPGASAEENSPEGATSPVDYCQALSAQEVWYRASPALPDTRTTEKRFYFQTQDARMLIVRQVSSEDGAVSVSAARWDPNGREIGNQEFDERQSARGFLDPDSALQAAGTGYADTLASTQPTLREDRVVWRGGRARLHNDIAVELEMEWTPPATTHTRKLRCAPDADCTCED